MSSASPKRNRSKVQKKGSHGGSRDGAGRKPSSSKLAVAAKGTFTLHTMGFKKAYDEADDGTTTSGLIKSSILTTSRVLGLRLRLKSVRESGVFIRYSTKKSRGLAPPGPPLKASARFARLGSALRASCNLINSEHCHPFSGEIAAAWFL